MWRTASVHCQAELHKTPGGGRKEGCSEQLRSLISVCAVVTDPASRLALICSTDRVSQSSAGVVFGNGIPVVDVFG